MRVQKSEQVLNTKHWLLTYIKVPHYIFSNNIQHSSSLYLRFFDEKEWAKERAGRKEEKKEVAPEGARKKAESGKRRVRGK